MKLRITTETGSIYLLDSTRMQWERIKQGEQSNPIRQDWGDIHVWPEVHVGEPLEIIGTSLTKSGAARILLTSFITEIREL